MQMQHLQSQVKRLEQIDPPFLSLAVTETRTTSPISMLIMGFPNTVLATMDEGEVGK